MTIQRLGQHLDIQDTERRRQLKQAQINKNKTPTQHCLFGLLCTVVVFLYFKLMFLRSVSFLPYIDVGIYR